VVLRFSIDPAGTASRVELVSAPDSRLGESAVTALRSASPFDPMPDRVRCLAGSPLVATFRNPHATAAN
jgi:TonB family protein